MFVPIPNGAARGTAGARRAAAGYAGAVARTCTFCAARPTAHELLPGWVAGALGSEAAGARRPARVLCDGCHAHFGETLDAPLHPLLAPAVAEDAPVALDPGDRRRVALWAGKTAAVLVAARRGQLGLPLEGRLAIRAGTPPDGSLVALARAAEPVALAEAGRLRAAGSRAAPPSDAPWFMTLGVGRLIVLAWGVSGGADDPELGPLPGGKFTRVWPAGDGDAAWPPLWPVEDHELRGLPLAAFRRARR